MKRLICTVLTLLLCAAALSPAANALCTPAPIPVADAQLLFTKKLGTGYRNAPTPPAVAGDALIVAAGDRIYRLDAHTGETLASQPMESVSTFTAVAPTVAEGTVYLPLDDGVVQAFDLETLAPLWIYTDPLGGQGLCPVVYEDGRLYTGFWNGETNEANYVCLPADGSGEQTAIWRFAAPGGFYRAEALIQGDYIVFGSDNAALAHLTEEPGTVYSLDKKTGRLCGSFTLPGDIRAGIGLDPDAGALYAATKAGALCRFLLDDATGELTNDKVIRLPGGMTVTPEIHNGRLYAACADGGQGLFLTLEADTLQTIYTAGLPGVPQGNLLLSTAYEAETGCVLLAATCNAKPGGIYVSEDAPGRTEAAAEPLFEPEEALAQYCFCPLAAGDDGVLYYKNDSGTIFAVAKSERQPERFGRTLDLLKQLLKRLALFAARVPAAR